MSSVYDGIIIGSGHNSLVLQAYLGQAGLDVVCLEARDVAGGGLTTMEDPRHPGFKHNTHSFYHRGITTKPWYEDLELDKHGINYLEPDRNAVVPVRDGRTLEWWTDFEKTVASFEQFSEEDADTIREWREKFRPIVENILVPESQSPPLPPERRQELLGRSEQGRTLREVSELSPLQFVEENFENDIVKSGLLFFNGLREVDLRVEGFGHHIPMLLASKGKAQMAEGGSAALARALVNAVEESGGEVRLNTSPRRILVENGRTTGVETTDGETINAREFVASGINPHQTFFELMDAKDVPNSWQKKVEDFRYNLVAPLFGLYVNLDEPPAYDVIDESPDAEDAFMVILGLEDIDGYIEIVENHEQGSIPSTVMWGSCPTKFDQSQAPNDKHTAFMWEKLPYYIDGDAENWDHMREQHGQEMLDVWQEYAPNVDDAVISSFVRSPLDTERTLPNMQEGDLLVGSFDHGQIGYNRPFPGAGHYRGHLDNLYLCGSSSHPGGNITGLVGYNCAQVMLADLGFSAPWAPPPIEDQLRGLE